MKPAFEFGCELLQLNLVFRNGPHCGKYLRVRKNPFVVGRAEDCDLRIGGSTVSRRHCMVRLESDRAVIVDLGSRNGTIVDHKTLSTGQEETLWHGDELRIGAWRLSVSLTDEVSGQPHRRLASTGTRLLDELDELNEAMESGHTTWRVLASSEPTQGNESASEQNHSDAEANAATQTDEFEAAAQSTVDIARGDADEKFQSNPPSEPAEQNSKGEPMKIPEHLRPKGPTDPQDAADQALQRIFNR